MHGYIHIDRRQIHRLAHRQAQTDRHTIIQTYRLNRHGPADE